VPFMHEAAIQRSIRLPTLALLFVVLLGLCAPIAWTQQHDQPSMPDMPGMDHGDMKPDIGPEDPAVVAKRLADKRESEFNHHLAGFLVILAGIFIFAEDRLSKRWPLVRYAWAMCFLAAGVFLLVFSDTEIFPFGPQSFWYAITHNREDLQHKIFAVILLALGYVQFERTRGKFKAWWTAWFFPVVALAAAILLTFHVHGGNMHAPHAMERMEHIQGEHRWFAVTGIAIGVTSGLAQTPQKWQQFFKKAWAASLVILGVLLMLYTE